VVCTIVAHCFCRVSLFSVNVVQYTFCWKFLHTINCFGNSSHCSWRQFVKVVNVSAVAFSRNEFYISVCDNKEVPICSVYDEAMPWIHDLSLDFGEIKTYCFAVKYSRYT